MQIFTVIIEECPKYSIDIGAFREEQAISAALALFAYHGASYFKQNGNPVTSNDS